MSRRYPAPAHFLFRDDMPDTIILADRQFKHCQNSTIEHDYSTMDRFNAAGLAVLDMQEGATPEQFVTELVSRAVRTGQLFPLLSHLLLPAGMESRDWTPAVAAETEAFLRTLTDPEDKKVVQGQVAGMFASFFQAGLTTLRTIPKYSETASL